MTTVSQQLYSYCLCLMTLRDGIYMDRTMITMIAYDNKMDGNQFGKNNDMS